ncbi:sensor histidine kinase [Paraflavitalea devenefica]|uniref:sensor histidine kinase n=1 Tax=Paraflavitalea devenefica TaxID=2716334 RepID=UPI00293BC9F3|nr:ATP-binding protein [Paraflavitalea devenefica]
MFIGTQQGFVFQIDLTTGNVARYFDVTSLIGKRAIIDKLYVDSNDRVWVFVRQEGVYLLDSKSGSLANVVSTDIVRKGDTAGNIIYTAAMEYDGDNILVGSNYGIMCLSIINRSLSVNTPILKEMPGFLSGSETFALEKDGTFLYISNSNGVFKYDPGLKKYTRIVAASGYDDRHWFTNVYNLFYDKNQLWLGNQQGVAWVRNLGSPYIAYRSSSDGTNVKIDHSYQLFALSDSSVISCASDGLYRVNTNNGNITILDKSQAYYQVIKIKDGPVIASGEKRMMCFKDGIAREAVLCYPELNKLDNDFIIASIVYKDSLVFMASENKKGIYVWDVKGGRIKVINDTTAPIRLRNLSINSFYIDENNKLWIIGDDLISIYDFQREKIEYKYIRDPITMEPLSILMDLCPYKDKYIMAVYGYGVVVMNKKFGIDYTLSSADGVLNTGLYKTYVLNDSIVVCSSNNGLYLCNLHKRKAVKVSEIEGLHSNSFDETSGSKIGTNIYLGGLGGFTGINSLKYEKNTERPACYFLDVKVKAVEYVRDTFDLFLKEITVPQDYTQLIVGFSGLYLSAPEKQTFFYRIKELHSEWLSLGNQNSLSLTGVSPGKYVLEVKSVSEALTESEPISLSLIFLPKWYQTWWFKTMIALLLMGILYSLYRYRLAQIRKEQQIRQRIASDLHDDIGSTLNSVKVFTNLALMKPENNITYLQQLKEGVQNAIVGVRDMVWVLDDKQDTLGHLLERIELFISPLASAQDIRFEKTLDAPLAYILLKKEEKRNLYLIIKEALNNSIKYASATTLQLIVEKVSHDRYVITIRDDGKGFDMDLIQKGNGLNNLQYRAQQIKYAIEIDSVPGKGTTIILTRP